MESSKWLVRDVGCPPSAPCVHHSLVLPRGVMPALVQGVLPGELHQHFAFGVSVVLRVKSRLGVVVCSQTGSKHKVLLPWPALPK